MKFIAFPTCAAACLVFASVSQATPYLPPPYAGAGGNVDGVFAPELPYTYYNCGGPGACTPPLPPVLGSSAYDVVSGAAATGYISAGPSPSATASAIGPYAWGEGILLYSFAVVGPSGPLPLVVTGKVSVSGTGTSFSANAFVTLPDRNQITACVGDCGGASFLGETFVYPVTVIANEVYPIGVSVNAHAYSADSNAQAVADPYVAFASGFTLASEYTFVFSQGIQNLPGAVGGPIDEPSAFATLLGGLSALGALRIARRKPWRALANSQPSLSYGAGRSSD